MIQTGQVRGQLLSVLQCWGLGWGDSEANGDLRLCSGLIWPWISVLSLSSKDYTKYLKLTRCHQPSESCCSPWSGIPTYDTSETWVSHAVGAESPGERSWKRSFTLSSSLVLGLQKCLLTRFCSSWGQGGGAIVACPRSGDQMPVRGFECFGDGRYVQLKLSSTGAEVYRWTRQKMEDWHLPIKGLKLSFTFSGEKLSTSLFFSLSSLRAPSLIQSFLLYNFSLLLQAQAWMRPAIPLCNKKLTTKSQ